VAYISSYIPPNEDHNGQTEEQHITDTLTNFQLHPMVNEPRNSNFPKLREPKKKTPLPSDLTIRLENSPLVTQ